MRRSIRYLLALVAGGTVTAIAGALGGSVILLAGIGQVYAVGTAVALRPDVRRWVTKSGDAPDAVFAGVSTFGVLSFAQGFSPEFHAAAAILAFGLAYFGLVCGIWTVRDEESPDVVR